MEKGKSERDHGEVGCGICNVYYGVKAKIIDVNFYINIK